VKAGLVRKIQTGGLRFPDNAMYGVDFKISNFEIAALKNLWRGPVSFAEHKTGPAPKG
jgi:hypothetical protein